MASIRAERLVKRYGAFQAVHGIDFEIADGEFVAILGPSGCGKSSTMRMIAGLETVTEGAIYFDGKRVNEVRARDRNVAMSFESYALYPTISIYENIAFPLRSANVDAKEIDRQVRDIAEKMELTALLNLKPKGLSSGQAQRVGLARALVRNPAVFLLDEPISHLDTRQRYRMRRFIKSLHQKFNYTMIYVTHDQEEAMTMADRIAVMSKGRVLQVGTPEEIYEHPVNRFVADFIGNVNMFEGRLTTDEPDHCAVTTDLGEIHVGHGISGAVNMPVAVAVRPEKLEISKVRPQEVSTNLFSGRVKEIAYFGSYNTYIVQAHTGQKVKITEANTSRHALSDITWEDDVFFWWGDNSGVVLRD